MNEVYHNLMENSKVQAALDYLEKDHRQRTEEQMKIAGILSCHMGEGERIAYCRKAFEAYGLNNITVDAEGNLYGVLPGTEGKKPKILVEAHIDTVYPQGTDTANIEREDGVFVGPGVGDNASGISAILSMLRAYQAVGLRPVGEVVFCMTVGEEGLGDLRGMKHFFKEHTNIDASISLDVTKVNGVVYTCVGSHRYEVNFRGIGGHSHANFGTPSAIHAMGRAIAKLAVIKPPQQPRTTYTVGVVEGGTSVNSIAGDAKMLVDIRSSGQKEMLVVEKEILACIEEGVLEENECWPEQEGVKVSFKKIGERPAGGQSEDTLIVQAMVKAIECLGESAKLCEPYSTNANIPISMGIPAIAVTAGGNSNLNHSMEEWFDPQGAYLGPQMILLATLGLAGLDGSTAPLMCMNKK